MSSIFIQKEGDNSKPTLSYRWFSRIQAMCSWRVLKIVAAVAVSFLVLLAYYLYLDKRYIVDEVYEGTKLRELTLKEKVTVRVVAPRNLDDLTKFVLEYSICQPVHEIQIVWLHEQNHPDESHFKYQHTHSKVRFIDTYGFSPYDSLYKDVKAETQSKLLLEHYLLFVTLLISFSKI